MTRRGLGTGTCEEIERLARHVRMRAPTERPSPHTMDEIARFAAMASACPNAVGRDAAALRFAAAMRTARRCDCSMT